MLSAWPPASLPPASISGTTATTATTATPATASAATSAATSPGAPLAPYCPNFLGPRIVQLLLANAVDSWDRIRQARGVQAQLLVRPVA